MMHAFRNLYLSTVFVLEYRILLNVSRVLTQLGRRHNMFSWSILYFSFTLIGSHALSYVHCVWLIKLFQQVPSHLKTIACLEDRVIFNALWLAID